MRKFIGILLVGICCIVFVTCGSSSDHTGEVKSPSWSSIMKGQDYKSVVEKFREEGFTNIKLEKIEDLVLGWLTKEGEVEEVSVGGDFDYSSDEWVSADTEVIIRYHAFPEKESEVTEQKTEENTKQEDTIENNDQNSKGEDKIDEVYANFANKYSGRTIEFDGRIDYVSKHGDYDTRYDILVGAGDYDPNHVIGPSFQFENVNYYDLGLDTLLLEEKIKVGKNVRIVAKVVEFNSDNTLFYLDPVSVIDR